MIVYHGSTVAVENPDISHSYRPLDFGKGFYVTSVREQAVRWARRKAALLGSGKAIVSIYDMQDNTDGLTVKTFDPDLLEWIDFVCGCRDGRHEFQQYDLICGKVANDRVFRVVDMYHMGIWEKERALKEIKVYPTYDQIAFITQKAIDQLLAFRSFEEVQAMSEEKKKKVYQENLEERIISYIAETYKVSFEDAMRIYYSSKLANKIHNGEYGVQYLDHKVLAQILFETEPELFRTD